MSIIKGQAIHKRNVSNKVVFIDIIETEGQKRHSVLFKTAENLCDQTVIGKSNFLNSSTKAPTGAWEP